MSSLTEIEFWKRFLAGREDKRLTKLDFRAAEIVYLPAGLLDIHYDPFEKDLRRGAEARHRVKLRAMASLFWFPVSKAREIRLFDLPPEVLQTLSTYLHEEDLIRLMGTCTQAYRFFGSDAFWKLRTISRLGIRILTPEELYVDFNFLIPWLCNPCMLRRPIKALVFDPSLNGYPELAKAFSQRYLDHVNRSRARDELSLIQSRDWRLISKVASEYGINEVKVKVRKMKVNVPLVRIKPLLGNLLRFFLMGPGVDLGAPTIGLAYRFIESSLIFTRIDNFGTPSIRYNLQLEVGSGVKLKSVSTGQPFEITFVPGEIDTSAFCKLPLPAGIIMVVDLEPSNLVGHPFADRRSAVMEGLTEARRRLKDVDRITAKKLMNPVELKHGVLFRTAPTVVIVGLGTSELPHYDLAQMITDGIGLRAFSNRGNEHRAWGAFFVNRKTYDGLDRVITWLIHDRKKCEYSPLCPDSSISETSMT